MLHRLRLVISAVIAALIVIVVMQNMEAVETDILFFTVVMPRAILLACTAVVGFVAGLLVAFRLSGGRK